jgi:hypothetical protein
MTPGGEHTGRERHNHVVEERQERARPRLWQPEGNAGRQVRIVSACKHDVW